MAKTDSKQKNVRLKLTTWFEVEDLMKRWECSRDAALEKAVAVASSPTGAVLLEADRRITEAIVSAPVPEVTAAPFHPMCKHCGAEFPAYNRFASLCPDCKKDRHIGDPRECPVCTGGSAI